MKKTILLASAATMIQSVAADCGTCSPTGFYAGVNLGFANSYSKQHWNVDENSVRMAMDMVPATTNQANLQRNIRESVQNFTIKGGQFALQYGLFSGFNTCMGGHMMMGAEIFLGGDSTKVDAMVHKPSEVENGGLGRDVRLGRTEVKRSFYYGLAPRVGFMVAPNVLAYVRLGIEGGRWQASYTPDAAAVEENVIEPGTAAVPNHYGQTQPTTPEERLQAQAVKRDRQSKMSFAPGFGVDIFPCKNMFMRVQYHCTFAPSMLINYDTSRLRNNGHFAGDNTKQTFKPTQHVFTMGVGCKF